MKSIAALICITFLLAFALYRGFDGVLLAGGCALLAGLGGYVAPRKKPPTKE